MRILRSGVRAEGGAAVARTATLYEGHAAMVLAICRHLLRDPVEAEDALQQTFLSAQRALRNGSQPREPAAWLATIARNECIARIRTRMREPLPTDAEPQAVSPDVHVEAVRREDAAELRAAIASLPAQQRDAIILRELRGLSYDEVAASLALTPSAVESLLFRARRGLQVRLRSAWATLSPVGWLASIRDLTTQLGSGADQLAGPAATKAVVIGIGTAVFAGGALVGPHALGRGHGRNRPARVAAAVTAMPAERSRPAPVVQTPTTRPTGPRDSTAVPTASPIVHVERMSSPQVFSTPADPQPRDDNTAAGSGSGDGGPGPTTWSTPTTGSGDAGAGTGTDTGDQGSGSSTTGSEATGSTDQTGWRDTQSQDPAGPSNDGRDGAETSADGTQQTDSSDDGTSGGGTSTGETP